MPGSEAVEAQFDHVDDAGNLVFHADGATFRVQVSDTLERAVLEARQLYSEATQTAPVHETSTLPISRIQAQIREGVDAQKVAEQYGLSEALVRRFTSSVQTEKQYAIEQFLTVPAPKGSRVHTIGDLIDLTLTAAHVSENEVTWSATRRSREPWKVSAQFKTERNRITAEWSWNMRDNSVSCLNTAARILLGESVNEPVDSGVVSIDTIAGAGRTSAGGTVTQDRIGSTLPSWQQPQSQPAASLQTGEDGNDTPENISGYPAFVPVAQMQQFQIQQMLAQQLQPEQMPTQPIPQSFPIAAPQVQVAGTDVETEPEAASAYSSEAEQLSPDVADIAAGQESTSTVPDDAPALAPADVSPSAVSTQTDWQPLGSETDDSIPFVQPQSTAQPAVPVSEPVIPSAVGETAVATDGAENAQVEPVTVETETIASTSVHRSKGKSGRSAMPSWDEILFGD